MHIGALWGLKEGKSGNKSHVITATDNTQNSVTSNSMIVNLYVFKEAVLFILLCLLFRIKWLSFISVIGNNLTVLREPQRHDCRIKTFPRPHNKSPKHWIHPWWSSKRHAGTLTAFSWIDQNCSTLCRTNDRRGIGFLSYCCDVKAASW